MQVRAIRPIDHVRRCRSNEPDRGWAAIKLYFDAKKLEWLLCCDGCGSTYQLERLIWDQHCNQCGNDAEIDIESMQACCEICGATWRETAAQQEAILTWMVSP